MRKTNLLLFLAFVITSKASNQVISNYLVWDYSEMPHTFTMEDTFVPNGPEIPNNNNSRDILIQGAMQWNSSPSFSQTFRGKILNVVQGRVSFPERIVSLIESQTTNGYDDIVFSVWGEDDCLYCKAAYAQRSFSNDCHMNTPAFTGQCIKKLIEVDIVFNPNEDFFNGTIVPTNCESLSLASAITVLNHELGHAVGLRHETSKLAVMNRGSDYCKYKDVNSLDFTSLKKIYPSIDTVSVNVQSPAENQVLIINQTNTFTANITSLYGKKISSTQIKDAEDSMVWTSSVDGQIATGNNVSPGKLTGGHHELTVTVGEPGDAIYGEGFSSFFVIDTVSDLTGPFGDPIAGPYPCPRRVNSPSGSCLFTFTQWISFGSCDNLVTQDNDSFVEDIPFGVTPGSGNRFNLNYGAFPRCNNSSPSSYHQYDLWSWIRDTHTDGIVNYHLNNVIHKLGQPSYTFSNTFIENLPIVDPEIYVRSISDCNIKDISKKCSVNIEYDNKYFLPDAGLYYKPQGSADSSYTLLQYLQEDSSGVVSSGNIVGVDGIELAVFQYSHDIRVDDEFFHDATRVLIEAPDGIVAGPFSVKAIASNIAPVASFTTSCIDLSCSFNASDSSDSDGTIASYSWSIGGTGVTNSKTYTSAGSYSVSLTVTDNYGSTNSLTKSVTVTASVVPPNINIAKSVCNNNYCIQLLGSNFDATASVQVRENVKGSGIIETYAGNDIYSRAPVGSEERIQFPIRDLDQQDKFNNNGLCFKVINSNSTSNEKCFVRPITADQPTFMGQVVESYNADQDKEHTSYVVVGSGGNKLKIWGNVWKKIASDYTVTPSTMLKFKFRSNQQQAEINGIGFIMNGSTSVASIRTWQVYGTQTSFGKQDFHDYVSSGIDAQWKEYIIPIGESFTGQISDMVFIADEDTHVGQNIVYKSPVLYEAPDQYDDVPDRRAYSDDVPGDAVSINRGVAPQNHNFYDTGDEDWVIFAQPHGYGVDINTTQLGNVSARLTAYRIDGDYSEISPGRWDITLSDLAPIASDNSDGNNSVTIQNTTGATQAYAIKVTSSGAYGANTDYQIQSIENNNFIDEYDDVPHQRAYDDDSPGDAVPIFRDATVQTHNFHDTGDVDWLIFAQPSGYGVSINTTQLGDASARLTAYRIDGAYSEISPGRWDFTLSDLTQIASDYSSGNNSVVVHNTTGVVQAYVIKVVSSGTYGNNTNYQIQSIENNPFVDEYDDVPIQRAYDDDSPGDAVPIFRGATAQTHNFHDTGDVDWLVFAQPSGYGVSINTTQLGGASARLTAYRIVGDYSEISPGRWDFTLSDLTQIASDNSSGNNSVVVQNTTGIIQAYVIKVVSSGAYGNNTNYQVQSIENNP